MLKDKGHYMIDETKLDKEQAKEFLIFMEQEKLRHEWAMDVSVLKVRDCVWEGNKNTLKFMFNYFCAKRHQQDIEMIQQTIFYLRNKFDL